MGPPGELRARPHGPRALPAARRFHRPGNDIGHLAAVGDCRLRCGCPRSERSGAGSATEGRRSAGFSQADVGGDHPSWPASRTHTPGSPTACKSATAAARGLGGAHGFSDRQRLRRLRALRQRRRRRRPARRHLRARAFPQVGRRDVRHLLLRRVSGGEHAQATARDRGDGGQPTGPGSGEANLDVEDISALAPEATIDVYEGPATDGTDYDPVDDYVASSTLTADQVVAIPRLCEQAIELGSTGLQDTENLLFEQAAAQGQSVLGAAGDNGSDDCNTFETSTPVAGQNPLSVDDPGSQPYVVSVGGTTIDDAATKPPLEHVWNDGADGGGGGGGTRSPGRCRPGSGKREFPGSPRRGAPIMPLPTGSNKPSAIRATSASRLCRVRPLRRHAGWYLTYLRRRTNSRAPSPSTTPQRVDGPRSAAPRRPPRSGRRRWR